MKITLPDALHARPANLLVRAARKLGMAVYVHKGERRADAREILQVLSLGAAKGDEVVLAGEDPSAIAAIAAVMEAFDPDLVPETGMAAAAGVAVGEALVVDDLEVETRVATGDEAARAQQAFAIARSELDEILGALAPHERQLFEPEAPILDALEPGVLARIAAGATAEEAIRAEAAHGPSDLLDDARARLLSALGGGSARIARALAEREGRELVLVTRELTPTLIAQLPGYVVGVIAVLEDVAETSRPPPTAAGTTSHAAILARGRGLPLVYVPEDVAGTIIDGLMVVIDTTDTEARVWGDPSEVKIAEAREKRRALARDAEAAKEAARKAHLLVALRANVGSLNDEVPEAAAGIGLVRTELVFAGRERAPREDEQANAYRAIAKKTRGPVYVRLFDAGGDKHLPFLVEHAGERGIELLLANEDVLRSQLDAIGRARDAGDVRVLIPLVRGAGDVEAVRARVPEGVPVGAMVETGDAAEGARAIAETADFVCIGTNDLAADVLETSREAAPDPFDPRVLAAIRKTVVAAHAAGRTVTVCGELAADPRGGRVLIGLGVDALSVAAPRLPAVALDLATATRDECVTASSAVLPSESA